MLKRFAFTLLSLIILPLLSRANNNIQALFEQGNRLYSSSKYKEAAAAYRQILEQEFQSPEVYFNLGNAYYKAGEIPYAILYYEKARKLAPADEDINLNLRIANLKTADKIEPVPEFFLGRWWQNIFTSLSVNTWAALGVLFVLLASGLLILYRFSLKVGVKKASFFSSIVFFVAGSIAVSFAAVQLNYFNKHQQAIVFSGAVSGKSEPQLSSKTLFVIHSGTKVQLLEKESNWLKIRLANGNEGWINLADVKEI